MRWWLALAFASVAALTAVSATVVLTHRAESAFRQRATELAAGEAVAAAQPIRAALGTADMQDVVREQAARRRLALFVADVDGRILTPPNSRGISLDEVTVADDAFQTALGGRRYLRTFEGDEKIVVALPLRGEPLGALLAVASRGDLTAEIGIVRDAIFVAAVVAVLVGATAGLVVALLIARRLRRIARAAQAIEGGDFGVELKPRFGDELGDLEATVNAMRVQLKHSVESLEAERNRLRRLFEGLREGIIAVDSRLSVMIVNRVAAQMLEMHSLHDGDPLPDFEPGLRLREFAAHLFTPGASTAETRFSLDGTRVYTLVGIPPPTEAGTAVLVFTDITERERREQAEREFVANAAHEMRTPLAALSSAVEALTSGGVDDPPARTRLLDVVERQTARLGRLSRALLVLARAQSRQEPIALQPVELRPLLETIAAGLSPSPGVSVDVDCPPGLGALAQPDLLEQVIANLAGNAVKHVHEGTIEFAARRVGLHVEVQVRDTGEGIGPAERERVFDRFYSRDRDGRESFGLGLAIVREAVRALGGTVEIESTPGMGTVVRVRLAAAGEAA
jgi:two-component system sensor histidine kinase VicK